MAQNPPPGWPRISPALFYDDPRAAIEWLERAFGFETRVKVDDSEGRVIHSELVLADGLIMVGPAGGPGERRSPRSLGGAYTQSVYAFVDQIDRHFERAREAGAKVISEPETKFYNHRNYCVLDPEGHLWCFAERVAEKPASGA